MDYQVNWTEPAKADLLEIWRYIAADNPRAADELRQKIFDQTSLLQQLPRGGPRYLKAKRGEIRHLVVGNYRIFYEVHEQDRRIEVLTVRHAARRDPKLNS